MSLYLNGVPAAAPEGSAVPTAAVTTGPWFGEYVIPTGDSLSEIAARFGVEVSDIMDANPQITDRNEIRAGDTLRDCRSRDTMGWDWLAGRLVWAGGCGVDHPPAPRCMCARKCAYCYP